MIVLIWPLVIACTIMLYTLILVTIPFNVTAATFFLFTLIAYWSRLPGVGIPMPFWILYMADVIDILAMIVAINMGGIFGGLLSLFANLVGRLSGDFTPWGGNISDAIAMFFTCLFIPQVHTMLGGDLFYTMVAFMIIRIVILVPLDLMGFYPLPVAGYIAEGIVTFVALFFFNSLYAKLFGEFFDNLMKEGVAFSWPLFTFSTIVIVIAFIIMFAFSKAVPSKKKVKKKEEKKEEEPEKESVVKKYFESESFKHDLKEHEEKEEKEPSSVIEHIEKGCPICKVDVKGSEKDGFYCAGCNLIYRRQDLKIKKAEEEQ